MELKIRKNGNVYIIDVNGEMDLYNRPALFEINAKSFDCSYLQCISPCHIQAIGEEGNGFQNKIGGDGLR